MINGSKYSDCPDTRSHNCDHHLNEIGNEELLAAGDDENNEFLLSSAEM